LIVAIVIVVVVVVIAVIALAFLAIGGSQAELTINVNTTHLLESVDYVVYVDSRLIDSGTLDPGYYVHLSFTYHWTSGEATVVRVSATSSGGGFGTQNDYEDVVVSDGGAYTVNLYI